MTRAQRSLVIASAPLAFLLLSSIFASSALARHGWRFRGVFVAPPVYVEVHRYPAYPPAPPPPPAPVPAPVPAAPCCYAPPPAPAMVVHAARERAEAPKVGLAIGGALHAPATGQLPVGGVVGALQFRTSPHSLLAVELHSLGARRLSDDTRRSELAGLLAGRVFLWNAALAPYLEAAGGLGRTSIEASAVETHASQLIGRLGLGLELRLGRHLVLEGQVAHVRKLRLAPEGAHYPYSVLDVQDDRSIRPHEGATELRAGLAFRF